MAVSSATWLAVIVPYRLSVIPAQAGIQYSILLQTLGCALLPLQTLTISLHKLEYLWDQQITLYIRNKKRGWEIINTQCLI